MPINRRKLSQAFVIALLVATAATASAQLGPVAYQRLKNIDRFALEPVGYAAITSEGESDFRILMHQDKSQALAQLEKLYAEGNPQAKAYALAGLHILNPERFNELNAVLPKITVYTESGCIGSTEPLASVAKEIASGAFDPPIKYPMPPTTPPHPQSPPPPPPLPPLHPAA